jgi:hypothetical protein
LRILADIWRELLRDQRVELCGRQPGGLDFADQRQGDLPGEIDRALAGEIRNLEHVDLKRVSARDLVIFLKRQRHRLVRLTEILDIVRDRPATRAGAARQKGKRGKAGGDAPTRARSSQRSDWKKPVTRKFLVKTTSRLLEEVALTLS